MTQQEGLLQAPQEFTPGANPEQPWLDIQDTVVAASVERAMNNAATFYEGRDGADKLILANGLAAEVAGAFKKPNSAELMDILLGQGNGAEYEQADNPEYELSLLLRLDAAETLATGITGGRPVSEVPADELRASMSKMQRARATVGDHDAGKKLVRTMMREGVPVGKFSADHAAS